MFRASKLTVILSIKALKSLQKLMDLNEINYEPNKSLL